MKKENLIHGSILLLAILIGGLISLSFGKEVHFDLVSYHFYNPYALLHHRFTMDTWSSSYVQMFITPTMDFLCYFLIHFFSPKMAEFILGGIHGINFWLLFCIGLALIPKKAFFPALLCAAVGMYGPISFSEIGSFMGDDLVSLFLLGAILLCLFFLKQKNKKVILCLSGLALGFGVGLKLTTGFFVVGFLGAFLFLPISFSERVKIIFLWSAAALAGLLISSGYWMVILWQRFHNPFFPLFNGIFHSPYFPQTTWVFDYFLPKNWTQALFFPFYFSIGKHWVTDLPFMDFRFLMVYILFFVAGFVAIKRRWPHLRLSSIPWIFLVFIFSYMTWQHYFSNMRYAVALEMLCPLIIFLLIQFLFKSEKTQWVTVAILFYTLIFTMFPMPQDRVPWNHNSYFGEKIPAFVYQIPTATVFVATHNFAGALFDRTAKETFPASRFTWYSAEIQTYLIPFFPQGWRFFGIPITTDKPRFMIFPELKKAIREKNGPFFILATTESIPSFYQLMAHFGLKKQGKCSRVDSDRLHWLVSHERATKVELCEVS